MDITEKLAMEVAAAAAPHADRHDLEGTFAVEGITAARDLGYLAAAVPADLGGHGALTRDVAHAQRLLARSCGSTALAAAMHHHVVLAAAWRHRRGDATLDGMLGKVAEQGWIVASSGGNDWTHPDTVATPVDGGWRVSGRKTFVSLAPVADAVATFAVVGEPVEGAEVIAFGLPMGVEGVRVDETWDSIGMRATGSHDVVLDDVFVAEAQVSGRRTWGVLDRPLLLASLHAWPVISATYLGVAEGLLDTVLDGRPRREPAARLVGVADTNLRAAAWALDGLLADLGDDPDPTPEAFAAIQQMKWLVTRAVGEVADAAIALAGGGAYARRGAVDRAVRELAAARYHPLTAEDALVHVGRARLELAGAGAG